MQFWRVEGEGPCPEILSARTLGVALGIHLAFLAVFWTYSALHDLFDKEEEVIPIDLTVVVNQNLNGKEDEPPPLRKPDPPPPPPKPKPKPKPKEQEKPKALEQIVTNVVRKVEKKPEKKVEPAKPKKSAEELRNERLAAIRARAKASTAKVVLEVRTAPSGDGRTAKKTLSNAEVLSKLNAGYRPGTSEQIATSELQLGFSLVKQSFEAKWDKPPWTDTLKPMTVRVWFAGGGKVVNWRLEKSSGDARADQSILSAASRVGAIPALPASFVEKYRTSGVPVQFTVRPQ